MTTGSSSAVTGGRFAEARRTIASSPSLVGAPRTTCERRATRWSSGLPSVAELAKVAEDAEVGGRIPDGAPALIAAHEIAHVFGAPHDGEEGGACATTTGNQFLMAPRINGSQQFSACSLAQMAPRVQAASCLQKLSPEGVVQPPVSPVPGGDGGGGGLAGHALAWLGLMALAGARRRLRQMRANQSAR